MTETLLVLSTSLMVKDVSSLTPNWLPAGTALSGHCACSYFLYGNMYVNDAWFNVLVFPQTSVYAGCQLIKTDDGLTR